MYKIKRGRWLNELFFPLWFILIYLQKETAKDFMSTNTMAEGEYWWITLGHSLKKYLNPRGLLFHYAKLNCNYATEEKKKRMDKTYILAGSESNRAKVLHLKIIQSSFQLTNTLSQRSSIAIWKGTEFFWTWAAVSPPWCPLTPEGMLGVVCVLQCFNLTLFNIILIFSPSSPWSL